MKTALAILAALLLTFSVQAQGVPHPSSACVGSAAAANKTAARESAGSIDSQPRDPEAEALRQYHERTGEMVRQTEARLHEIPEQVAAGGISAEQGQALKLAATRAMLARLEGMLAVYDARVGYSAENATVSVKELRGNSTMTSAAK
jgi:hypothetical protein